MTHIVDIRKKKAAVEQLNAVMSRTAVAQPKHWDRYFGKVSSFGDPVAYQRSLRDE